MSGSAARRLLLTVADTFEIRGRGLVVAPFLPAHDARKGRFYVELRRPDGSTSQVEAYSQIPFIQPTPKEHRAHLVLLDVAKGDVPMGTAVYVD